MGGISAASLHACPACRSSLVRGYWPTCPCRCLESPAEPFRPDKVLKPVAASLPAPLLRAHTSECETGQRTLPSSGQQFHKKCWQWLCCPWGHVSSVAREPYCNDSGSLVQERQSINF